MSGINQMPGVPYYRRVNRADAVEGQKFHIPIIGSHRVSLYEIMYFWREMSTHAESKLHHLSMPRGRKRNDFKPDYRQYFFSHLKRWRRLATCQRCYRRHSYERRRRSAKYMRSLARPDIKFFIVTMAKLKYPASRLHYVIFISRMLITGDAI